MYYNSILTPTVIRTGNNIIKDLDNILESAHLHYPRKILVTQENLHQIYRDTMGGFLDEVKIVKGGDLAEANELLTQFTNDDNVLLLAFGGGSVLDVVKYVGTKLNLPYISIPSALSNDAIYSSVARLTSAKGKKRSFNVQPPLGVILDISVIQKSPRNLILAGVGDLITNLSAVKDWEYAHNTMGEPVNELSCMLAKQAAMSIWGYYEEELYSYDFLYDLGHGLITSGLSMTVAGHTRASSGSEHMISHAIDEFFPEKATLHGFQVAWAFITIERLLRKDKIFLARLTRYFDRIGLTEALERNIPWTDEDFYELIPYALKVRKRYTILNSVQL